MLIDFTCPGSGRPGRWAKVRGACMRVQLQARIAGDDTVAVRQISNKKQMAPLTCATRSRHAVRIHQVREHRAAVSGLGRRGGGPVGLVEGQNGFQVLESLYFQMIGVAKALESELTVLQNGMGEKRMGSDLFYESIEKNTFISL